MPFDGIFLHHLINELSIIKTGRISKVNHISTYEIILQVRCNYQNKKIIISLHPEYSRIHFTENSYDTPYSPSSFTMFLRKHLEGAIIKDITQYKSDRVIIFDLVNSDEIGDKHNIQFILEIMGRRSNLIITENNIIIDTYKHTSPIEDSYRTLFPNAVYKFPDEQNKIDTLAIDDFKPYLTQNLLSKSLMGVSKPLGAALEESKNEIELKKLIYNLSPTLYKDKKDDFYYTDISTIKGEKTPYKDLSSLLDDFYYNKETKERIKQKSSDLTLFVARQIEKLGYKIEKLNQDLKKALDSDILRIKGELLLSTNQKTANQKEITLFNYYTNEDLTIALDPLLSIIENSNKYFSKYQKMRKSVSHLKEQINLTTEELNYFTLIKIQLDNASLNDSLEIKEELEQAGYIKKNNNIKRKSKNINYEIHDLGDATIYVGKNNLQNSHLTHKLALSSDYWFHVKDAPGSHVILHGEMNEKNIRFAANMAAYYSKYQQSSSVAVDYTMVRYIKKIPGRHSCFVTYTNQKTIYIDPKKEASTK